MPRNGSGTYSLPQPAFVMGTKISSSAVNSDLSDIAAALTQSISADGQTPLTGSIKFASGNAVAPGVTFAGDTTTGVYLNGAGSLGLSAGGVSLGTFTGTAATWAANATFSGTLTASGTLSVTGNSTFTGTVNDPRGQYTGVLLNTLTANNSAALQDTTSLTSNYNWYEIIFQNLVPATNAVTLALQYHSGGTYQSSTYLCAYQATAGSSGSVGTSTGGVPLNSTAGDLSNNSSLGVSGFIKIFSPSLTTSRKMFVMQTCYPNTTPTAVVFNCSGYWNGGNGAVDGFQVASNSGNISSGTVKVYGYV